MKGFVTYVRDAYVNSLKHSLNDFKY